MSSLFGYLDYRDFLRDFYYEKKKEHPFFSYRIMARRVGMDSSFVIKVLQGNLHISNKKIPAFCTLCGLSEPECEYFDLLVRFSKAKTEKERRLYFHKLIALSPPHAQKFDLHQYAFFTKWYHSAIWSLLSIQKFKGRFSELASLLTPPITAKEAKESIRLLEKLKLVARDDDGCYVQRCSNLTTGKRWQSEAIRHFQMKSIELAREAVQKVPSNERNISTLTLTLPADALPDIEEYIAVFRKSLIKIINGYEKPDRVYQLNIELFPLTKRSAR